MMGSKWNLKWFFLAIFLQLNRPLFGEKHPDAREVFAEVVGLDCGLLRIDPRLDHVRLPHELQHGAVLVLQSVN